MTLSKIGVLHPGEMGASVAAALVAAGARACWCRDDRSAATGTRAERAGLIGLDDLRALAASVDGIVSVCPPAFAYDVATSVRDAGFAGGYLDANAVSPDTTRRIAALFEGSDVDFVDGGIVGPPAWKPGTTRLYLSGATAEEIARWFAGSALETVVIAGSAGAASALKMVYAGWTKGTTALLAALFATARAEGVDAEILTEWERSQPDVPIRLTRGIPASAPKAWRFADEMKEIAATLEAAGLPGDFHQGAAEIYERLANFKNENPTLEQITDRLINAKRKR